VFAHLRREFGLTTREIGELDPVVVRHQYLSRPDEAGEVDLKDLLREARAADPVWEAMRVGRTRAEAEAAVAARPRPGPPKPPPKTAPRGRRKPR
jgi:hypothetical protein